MKDIQLDKTFIKSKIQELLNQVHTDSRKQKIIEHHDRLQYSCPICGDSQKIHKIGTSQGMRGNLYFKNLMHICFNENCNMSIIKLLKTFNVPIGLEKKVNIYNYIDANIKYTRSDDNFVVQKLDKLIDINELVEYFNNDPKSDFEYFAPIKKNSRVYQHLKYDRFIDDFSNLYEAKYRISKKWVEPVIVILNKSGDKILGIQIRNLKSEKRKRLFKTYNFEKLYNFLHQDDPLDEIEALSYNKLSNFYNILNVDWEQPVTIFEGYLDSIFMNNNAIGAIGINSTDDMGFLLDNDEDLKLQFFFDQDNIGVRKSLQKLNEGYSVFLWQKLIEDFVKNSRDKYKAKRYLLKIKDLNELVIKINNANKFKKINFQRYFSNDEFDRIYLDYTKYSDNQKKFTKKYRKS